MDYRRFFGNRRTRRRSSRLVRPGDEMIDLLQLMRRRFRYRPYVATRFVNRSRETNLINFNYNPRENLEFYHEAEYREISNSFENMERRNVSTNTDLPCCPASVLNRNQRENIASNLNIGHQEFATEAEATHSTANQSLESQACSVNEFEFVRGGERLQSAVETAEKSNANVENQLKEVYEVQSENSNINTQSPVSSLGYIESEYQDPVKNNDLNTISTDLSSNIDEYDQPCEVIYDISEDTLASPTTSSVACTQVLHSTESIDVEAGGDGHHNNPVLEFQITLTTTAADVEANEHIGDEEEDQNVEHDNNDEEEDQEEEEDEHENNDANRAI